MKRITFLQYTLSSASILTMMPSIWTQEMLRKKGLRKIVILYTNDQHSQIDPLPANDSKYPNGGGFAKRAALIRQIRSEEENVLLLDAGDIFQGTPYFNFYGGELEFKLMSHMGYDASTMGNHDFDNGLDGFVKQLPNAKFPFLNVNYDTRDTALEGKLQPWLIKRFDGIRVGIFGLGVELHGLVDPKLYDKVKYLNPIEKANKTAHFLKKEEKCDLIICLSHLGYEYTSTQVSDKMLAASSYYIDLIVGGHTHTFLSEPTQIKNLSNQITYVTQVGWKGLFLGRMDFIFDEKNTLHAEHHGLYKIFKKTI